MPAPLALAGFALAAALAAQDGGAERTARVGLPMAIEGVVIDGPRLEPKPAPPAAAFVLRITAIRPHGSASRYDFSCYALEPGSYDLADHLVRADGSPTGELPRIPLRVAASLPPGQVLPNALPPEPLPRVGGYRALQIAAGAAWILGLAAIFAWRRRRSGAAERGAPARPATLAERLGPLVERARLGQLSQRELAELELGLVAWWRRRLDLGGAPAREAIAALKAHAEAGPLLRKLEEWLHHPAPNAAVDVAALLAPYRDLPADALETAGA